MPTMPQSQITIARRRRRRRYLLLASGLAPKAEEVVNDGEDFSVTDFAAADFNVS